VLHRSFNVLTKHFYDFNVSSYQCYMAGFLLAIHGESGSDHHADSSISVYRLVVAVGPVFAEPLYLL